jgi:glutathione peroxidase
MARTFSQQRNAHGPRPSSSSSSSSSSFSKALYALVAIAILFFLYSTKFLFEERYTAHQNTVLEATGRQHHKRRREKADAIKLSRQHLRSADGVGDGDGDGGEDSIFQFDIPNIDGEYVNIGDTFGGKYKLLLIVNVASKCGKTLRNYDQLQELYRTYHPLGLEIVAIPCDQFKHQEPGTNKEIEIFAREEMGAEFPVMGKTEVNGPKAHALFKHLREKTMNGKSIKWNFAKFLVDAKGMPIMAYEPKMDPKQMEGQIKLLLDAA